MMKAAHPSMGTRVSDAAGEALDATTQAIDNSRQFASDAAGKVGEPRATCATPRPAPYARALKP